ncbi:phytanoyl-CoA dioxygenase family protein [Allomuricauda sp. SCSIO 65647]|uniref:phytanoyl-CoA dioxygenase family protein n=1 Tax=Allomuricauda sp. SCSIO 65647 TaxID=2908843 RepID=UPI001F3E4F09|nr:phytanoyl-CoA dioxygenase family protein [Muricauda sp. SCSIO 65647]UJH68520.1 2OG-Fe(II) oxygenase [Muricauda sp. SCSIO 65647]
MDFKKIHDTFWDQGYIIFEKFFDDTLMDGYNEKILKHYGVNPNWEHTDEFISKSAVEVIPWFPYRDGSGGFDGIDKDEDFNQITDAILKNGWNNLYCMMMFSKAGSKGQAWHQDCPPENPIKYNLNRLVYTHDITDETGGEIVIMPKAHKAGILPVGKPHEDIEGQLIFQPKKGTVVFLHGHCFHRVMPVKKDRISTNFRAVPIGTPEDITDICVYRNMRYRFSTSEVIEERQ